MINTTLILNVIIGLLIYNMIFKALGNSLIKAIINSKPMGSTKKDFKEQLKKKLEETK